MPRADKPYPTAAETRLYQKLPNAGFWAMTRGDASGLPWPADLIDPSWDMKERMAVADYLDEGKVAAAYRGWSTCRICLKRNGSQDWTDGSYVYPEGLSHYVRDHGVKLPEPFLSHIRSRLRASVKRMSSCPCEKTVALLRKLGAKHAARMHEEDADQKEWTAADWRAHIEEEERLLFPLLAPLYPRPIELLRAEHKVFLIELQIFGGKIASAELMARHAELEDRLAGLYVDAHPL